MAGLLNLTAHELSEKIGAGEVSASEAAEAANRRVEEVDGDLNSFVTATPELALERAGRVDGRLRDGGVKPWETVPIVVKDVLSTRGVRTTCGSKILEDFTPLYDASALVNFGEEPVMVGKSNMDEFAMGSSTENSAYGPTRNPWDANRVPGGSSGGSAAAVAAGEGWWALGTDTGGSVRQPAALCGIVGLKPTYGRVSRYGLISFGSSLDCIGPMTRDVRDSALLLQAIAGHDPCDSTSANVEVPDYLAGLEDGVEGLRVGVVTELMDERIDAGVREVTSRVAVGLEAAGAEVGEVSLPHAYYALEAYYIIAPAEVSSHLARFDGVRYGLRVPADGVHEMYRQTRERGFGAEAKRRIMLGTYALSSGYYDAYYAQAQKVRTKIIEDFRNAYARYDVLVSPTSPSVAFEIGAKTDDPL
ncbi:MAG TPA: Asp-tRNA(Asn)/Glu-tRNA(Gln) amidotransferase subunit GatA, partial [Rubrobacter sp.]|nr:Asp-tRNA(Asn)/Glu-tRNA(Gln) amidotransferase subunit GatA [Rubrobacter sp.]